MIRRETGSHLPPLTSRPDDDFLNWPGCLLLTGDVGNLAKETPFMMRTIIVSVALALGMTAVMAQGDPITQRKDLMKANGSATRIGTQMVKGEIPFDPAKAK